MNPYFRQTQKALGVQTETWNVYSEHSQAIIGYCKDPQNWRETFEPIQDWKSKFSLLLKSELGLSLNDHMKKADYNCKGA